MSSKRGRKCSIKTCDNFQHTHKHLSFFRFPKDTKRCSSWIEKTQRFDLLDKVNVHDERICQQHFEPAMFLNESQNRLQQYAVPTLYLTTKPPIVQPSPTDRMSNGSSVGDNVYNNAKFDMSMIDAAAILLQQNNLTITPVFSSPVKQTQPTNSVNQHIQPVFSQNHSFEPVNLSISTKNKSYSPDSTITLNESNSSNGSLNNSNQLQVETMPTNGFKPNPLSGGFRRPRQVFTFEQENQLADYVRETSNYYSGLSSKEVRILAFVYGVCNQVDMPIGWRETHQASFDWCVGFIKRTKLPPAMITGISKSGKHSKAISEHKPTKAHNFVNGNIEKTDVAAMNVTPIEID